MEKYSDLEQHVIHEIFSPVFLYRGNVDLYYEDLLDLAKRSGHKRDFETFYMEQYYRPFSNIMKDITLSDDLTPAISLDLNRDGSKRNLHFSYVSMVEWLFAITKSEKFEIIDTLYDEEGNIKSPEFCTKAIKEMIREERIKLSRKQYTMEEELLLRKEYEALKKFYNKPFLSFDSYLEGRIAAYVQVSVGTPALLSLYDKSLDINKFVGMFDLDSLLFYVATRTMEVVKLIEKEQGDIHQLTCLLKVYDDFLKKRQQDNPSYYQKIKGKFCFGDEKATSYDTTSFQKDLYELMEKYSASFTIVEVPDTFSESITDINAAERIREEWRQKYLARLVGVEFEIIPKGEKLVKTEVTPSICTEKGKTRSLKAQKSRAELFSSLLERKGFFEGTDYRYEIRGTDKFAGYVGYIYNNGTVIFEKYYKDVPTKEPAVHEATYVMRIDNFIELSRLTKTEIMSYIDSNQDGKVVRLYHTPNWRNKVNMHINKEAYEDGIVEQIDTIIKVATQGKNKCLK